jgi:hypothetical protein
MPVNLFSDSEGNAFSGFMNTPTYLTNYFLLSARTATKSNSTPCDFREQGFGRIPEADDPCVFDLVIM